MKKLSLKRQLRKLKDVDYDLREIIHYLLGGGLYFLTGYICFFIFYHQFKWTLFYAIVLANVIGWIVNYLVNRYWVFQHSELKQKPLKVTSRYITITLIDFGLNYLIIKFFQIIGISPYISQFISAGFFTFWNYYWYKLWVFKHSPRNITY